MININIICVGKLKEKYLKDAVEEYTKRISKYSKIQIIELQDEKIPEKYSDAILNDIKEKEAKKILEVMNKKDAFNFILDLKGKEYTSENFSSKIQDITVKGFSTINFVIGGTLGLTDEIRNKANDMICFSKMTFPHQLIRVFLLEQIFRAFKIANNETYHW